MSLATHRNLAAAVSIAAGLFAASAILYEHTHRPTEPAIQIINGAPHLHGAHQPLSTTGSMNLPDGRTAVGAGVLRRDSDQKGELHAHAKTGSKAEESRLYLPKSSREQSLLPLSPLRNSETEAPSKEGVTDGPRKDRTDMAYGAQIGRDDGATTNRRVHGHLASVRDGSDERGVATESNPARAVKETPWTLTRVADVPTSSATTSSDCSPLMTTSAPVAVVESSNPAITTIPAPSSPLAVTGDAATVEKSSASRPMLRSTASATPTSSSAQDCRPSADTILTPSAAAWIAKANAWADSIDARYPRSISIYYDRLRCNGSIPFGWYVSTHNTLTGAAFSDETPVEWMCAQHMDSPLAAMMVRTVPVMRPAGTFDAVVLSYNDHWRRLKIGDGTEYAGCGVTVDKPCVFRAPFPCVWPMEKIFDDGKGNPVAVVSGWDVKVRGRIDPLPHLRMLKE